MWFRTWVLVGSMPALFGCASGLPLPAARLEELGPTLAAAHASLREAREAGARRDLGAGLYLSLAEHEMAAAHTSLGVRDEKAAIGWAMRARADADLACTVICELGARDAARRTAEEAARLSGALLQPLAAHVEVAAGPERRK